MITIYNYYCLSLCHFGPMAFFSIFLSSQFLFVFLALKFTPTYTLHTHTHIYKQRSLAIYLLLDNNKHIDVQMQFMRFTVLSIHIQLAKKSNEMDKIKTKPNQTVYSIEEQRRKEKKTVLHRRLKSAERREAKDDG